ncbi:antibiotic biosynthesis monooxygenase [Gracilibacillus salitolerans]|uniref:Antibiotic biosynthesis monooxygenase n=1 Tax=Gracilibacillus salitolerans TaxID=2663022 RepID=A0A5Q2TIB4_9BACI|nr:antibiotic biosynthesis monooxygenase family protein [Gracilibacillus salitolerans]QGH34629.1 antibiotic biosynthesis monooxygenase [Gracilibacillus salitolerans]
MSSNKVIIAGWFTVDASMRNEVVEIHEDLIKRARRAPGCIDLAITADPVDTTRINNFEFWQSEEDLEAWRAIANPPKEITPILNVEMQKHEIKKSGPPF